MRKTKEQNSKTNKGITLIALVITIVVMLILVAVTISMAVNGGLFNYAKKATSETKDAINEEQQLASGGVTIDGVYYNSIDEYLGTDIEEIEEEKFSEIYTETKEYKDENGDIAIVPKGFAVGVSKKIDTVDEGLVIQDEDRNEYVWIPVSEGTFERTIWWENEPTTKTLEEITEDFELDDYKVYIAKSYGYSSIADMMREYGEEPFENYEDLLAYEWKEAQTQEEVEQYTIEWFNNSYWLDENFQESHTEDASTDPTGEYTNMVRNVMACGGFYIGRYEAGSKENRVLVRTDETVLVKKGAYPYNNVTWGKNMTNYEDTGTVAVGVDYGHGAVYLCKHMYDNKDVDVTSTLCYGVQWDAVLRFVKDEVDVTDSTNWGNYYNSKFKFSGEYSPDWGETWSDDLNIKPQYSEWLLKTGSSEQNKAKNIYDLGGNVTEWTMEAESEHHRVIRGAECTCNGFFEPAANRYMTSPGSFSSTIGFRPALYVHDPNAPL